jgi:hypothetical protein
MARVEKQSSVKKQIEDVKADVVKEVKQQRRKKRPWMSCSVIILVVVLLLMLWGVWSVAATGLTKVPVFSRFAYTTPEPTRLVEPGIEAQDYVKEWFATLLTQKFYDGRGTINDVSFDLSVSEEILTTTLRSLVNVEGVEWIDVDNTQVVVDPEVGIELYFPLSKEKTDTAIIAIFDISVEGTDIKIKPIDVALGQWHVPNFLVASFLVPIIERQSDLLNQELGGYVSVKNVQSSDAKIDIEGDLTIEIQHPL